VQHVVKKILIGLAYKLGKWMLLGHRLTLILFDENYRPFKRCMQRCINHYWKVTWCDMSC
jgi:hypothetical protein